MAVDNPLVQTLSGRNQVVGAAANLDLVRGDLVCFDNSMTTSATTIQGGRPAMDVDDAQNQTANTLLTVGVAQGNIAFGDVGPFVVAGETKATVLQYSGGDAVDAGDYLAVDLTTDLLRFVKWGAALGTGDAAIADGEEWEALKLLRAIALEDGTDGTGEDLLTVRIINNPIALF
tara:strand:- start:285 stop:809 length:525 start_codon:yes stop_codon:yes gene_type:complete